MRAPEILQLLLVVGTTLGAAACREPQRSPPASALPATASSPAESAAGVASSSAPATVPSVSSASSASLSPPSLPPLRDAAWLEALDLGEGDAASVSPPLGATEPRPLVVAVHGAHDRPDWACGGWRLGLSQYPFVVCPRGTPVTRDKYAWPNTATIARVTLKAIARVRERFGAHVAAAPYVFAGFSQGATLAEPFLLENAALFPTAILAEGGYATLESVRFARGFRDAGGKTVVIVCGTPGCKQRTSVAARRLESSGLRVFESGDVRSGHNLNQRMQTALQRDFAGWFSADPAWSSAVQR